MEIIGTRNKFHLLLGTFGRLIRLAESKILFFKTLSSEAIKETVLIFVPKSRCNQLFINRILVPLTNDIIGFKTHSSLGKKEFQHTISEN